MCSSFSQRKKIELILEGKDYKNRKLFSIVEVNTKTQNAKRFADVHVVNTVYGNKNILKRIATAEAENRLIYKKEEPAQGIPQVQYERDINDNSSNSIIHKSSEKINTFGKKITETKQFKRFFGDWQNNPEGASKVVNADGTPRVVYHGSNQEFSIFDLQMSGKNFGETSQGFFFFTNKKSAYPNSASDYAENASKKEGKPTIYECYLSIKKPLRLDSKGYDIVVDIRNDVPNGKYSKKEQFVYSIEFYENKKVATSVTAPAKSKFSVNLDITTNDSISENGEKINTFDKKLMMRENLFQKARGLHKHNILK